MKKLIPVLILAMALSSCAVKTVSRTELFTPNTATLINSEELTGMMYYGADNEYDYFSRGFQRLRVAKSEDAIPNSARFTFNNWQGGKKYTECLKESLTSGTLSKLQSLLTGNTTYNATTVPATTPTTTSTPTVQQQRMQALQSLLQTFSQQ
ncbi:MAG: hypothetical protein IKZ13_00750 [Akkermansia sp.]|nr:hypothetical protein [Akkermansia sp.]